MKKKKIHNGMNSKTVFMKKLFVASNKNVYKCIYI